MTIDPALIAAQREPDAMSIGVLERNRLLLGRAARVMRAAAALDWICAAEDPQRLRERLDAQARMIACEGDDAEELLSRFPDARLAAWSHEPHRMIALAARDDRMVSLLGWPAHQSMPRSWELALATRTILWAGPEATTIRDILSGSPVTADFFPQTPSDRDTTISQIATLAERAGATERISARIGEVAHELVVNASYDAPIDASGEPRYAHDRRAPITLEPTEIPHVQVATDGLLVVVRVGDRFGRLTREHVLASVQRGVAASRAVADDVVDTTNGGAGLGLWRVYSGAAVTIVDVLPGHSSTVTAVFDIDLGARDARTLPPSLHLFDRGRLG